MNLVEQWRRVESELPAGWAEARLALEVLDDGRRERAAALLGPFGPGSSGATLRLSVPRSSSESLRRLLRLLDRERIAGSLSALGYDAAEDRAAPPAPSLVEEWEAELAKLPPDWGGVLAELELASSDHLAPAALLCAPLNTVRVRGRSALRFRVARDHGYGAAPGMARRCLASLDADGIRARVRVLESVSRSDPVYTQGPVLAGEGKPV